MPYAEAFIAKLNCLRFEAIELINRQQQAGPAGELGLENSAQSVDGVQIVKIEGSNERATSRSDDDKSFSLKTSQRLANRDEAHVQHRRDLP